MFYRENRYGNIYYYKDKERKILHKKNRPAIVYKNGDKEWYVNGFRHREDGPAKEYKNGYKEWWANGILHRIDGAAVEYPNGDKEWWLNGNRYSEQGYWSILRFEGFV